METDDLFLCFVRACVFNGSENSLKSPILLKAIQVIFSTILSMMIAFDQSSAIN